MNQEWDTYMEELLPDFGRIDSMLRELMPTQSIHMLDLIQKALKGNWVMEPEFFWKYIQTGIVGYISEWKKLFITLLLLFIVASMIAAFLNSFGDATAARTAEFFFLLCQLVILAKALEEVMMIVSDTMQQMLDFLKLAIPSYMICVAAAGSGLSATIFYKLFLGFLCLIEGIVVAACMPAIQAYMLLGTAESLFGEERFCGIMELIKKTVMWILKGLIVLIGGSGLLQLIITPAIDRTNLTLLQKTAGALPIIGDIAESITDVTVAAALAVKSSFGVAILIIMILMITVPILKAFMILGTIKLGAALGSIAGERRMLKCADYMTDAGFLMLRMLITVSALFFLAIAVITKATS